MSSQGIEATLDFVLVTMMNVTCLKQSAPGCAQRVPHGDMPQLAATLRSEWAGLLASYDQFNALPLIA